jgi:hypothetical protein
LRACSCLSPRAGDDRETTLAQSCREVGEDLGGAPSQAEQLPDPTELSDSRSLGGQTPRYGGSVGRPLGNRFVAADDDLVPLDAGAGARDDPTAVQKVLGQANPPASRDDDRLTFVTVPPCLAAYPPVAHVHDPVGDCSRRGIVADDDRAADSVRTTCSIRRYTFAAFRSRLDRRLVGQQEPGLSALAAATAIRCCSPPELERVCPTAVGEADDVSRASARSSCRSQPAAAEWSATSSQR